MHLVLSLSEDTIANKKGIVENIAKSISQFKLVSQLIQVGMKSDATPFNALFEAHDSLLLDSSAYSQLVLDSASDEAQEFNASNEESDLGASFGEIAFSLWEGAIDKTKEDLQDDLDEFERVLPDSDDNEFVVTKEWLEEVHSLGLDIVAHAEGFPEEISLEPPDHAK